MIEVKIARNLTRDGVEGLRWVLLDPPEAAAAAAPVPKGGAALPADGSANDRPQRAAASAVLTSHAMSPGLGLGPVPAPAAPRQALMLGALKTLVLLLALGAAVVTAWGVIGPPRWPGARTALPRALPASESRPAASAPVLTAGLMNETQAGTRTGAGQAAREEVAP